MAGYAARTGLSSPAVPRRYLWTDAFAVCNYLSLHRHTGAPHWLARARQLIDQVHHVLGRHRTDDERTGWISGLTEAEAERHPTARGLRIGKPLPERSAEEKPNERVDWDRDGQYYHYLTRWAHALERASDASAEPELLRYAHELMHAAHRAFRHGIGGEQRLYWKMTIDLSQPVVAAMGQHDALDGLTVTTTLAARAPDAQLDDVVRDLAEMCAGRSWATTDALGIGGLLVDALQLARLTGRVPAASQALLDRVLRDAARSLDLVTMGDYLEGSPEHRLPFRELGLSLGLAAVARLEGMRSSGVLPDSAATAAAVQSLAQHLPLRAHIESFWLQPEHHNAETWREHEDINAVMLATSLLPDGYL